MSLPEEDVEYLDRYARELGLGSRSAALQKAVRLLRASQLGDEYEQAWAEWDDDGDAQVWEITRGDGLDD